MSDIGLDRTDDQQRAMAARVDAVGWGIFFIWVGVALLTYLSWPVFFLGTGTVMLAVQSARRYLALKVDRFSLGLGTVFVVASLLRILDLDLELAVMPALLMPFFFIAMGGAIIVFAWKRRSKA